MACSRNVRPYDAPELRPSGPFRAEPLIVSGTDAYRGGEYLYQDFLYDDHGADTSPGLGSARQRPGLSIFSASAGDYLYPTDPRFGSGAADLAELRLTDTSDALVVRATFTTLLDATTTALTLVADTDGRRDGTVPWPFGAGISSDGTELALTAWGTGGAVTTSAGDAPLPDGAVEVDLERNQLTVRVPHALADPAGATWRVAGGTGAWDAAAGRYLTPVPGIVPTAEVPASGGAPGSPAIVNLAFRFDEPVSTATESPGAPAPGVGSWFEDRQAAVLADGTSGDFFADVDFGALGRGVTRDLHPPGRTQARVLASRTDLPEGVVRTWPQYGSRLQPYLLTVPEQPQASYGLTFLLHATAATYTQFAVGSPRMSRQLGDERGAVTVTPLSRGHDMLYDAEAELDLFEVWADVARHVPLDPDLVLVAGYSQGGYGAFKYAAAYPDLFGAVFSVAAAPNRDPGEGGEQRNTERTLQNLRHVPFLQWNEVADQIEPFSNPLQGQRRASELGLRSQLWGFAPGDHLTLSVLDEWRAAAEVVGEARRTIDPSRVVYAALPAADVPRLGLVHDGAYWVSDVRARAQGGDPDTAPDTAEVDARSLTSGTGDPVTAPIATTSLKGPSPAAVLGTRWESVTTGPRANALDVGLTDVCSSRLDAVRAGVVARQDARIEVRSDGPSTVVVDLPVGRWSVVSRSGPPAAEGPCSVAASPAVVGRQLVMPVSGGTTSVVLQDAAGVTGAAQDGSGTGRGTTPRLAATGGSPAAPVLVLVVLTGAVARLRKTALR